MVNPRRGTKKKQRHMTHEEAREVLDAWASEQNEIACRNQRVLSDELAEYAERAGIDWRTVGGLEAARKLRGEDAERGRKFIGGVGRPFKVPPEELCTAVAIGHERYPQKAWTRICEEVAMEFKVGRQTVLDHSRTIAWGERMQKK